MNESKHRNENAKAIKNCLEYLSKEAKDIGLCEVAQLIDVAVLAAEDVSDTVH